MKYGLCHLSVIPVRKETTDTGELVTQLLYGDVFKIIERRKNWCKIVIAFDDYEGWIDAKQMIEINSQSYHQIVEEQPRVVSDLVEFISDELGMLQVVTLGATVNCLAMLNQRFDGNIIQSIGGKHGIVKTALMYLNTPYMWGGKTPFGIDCSGFTQMVYKINGYQLFRDASQQAKQGETLSFIEECEPGDLAFFDNSEGKITHVGIVLQNHQIIHAHGKVRIDRLDQSGIFNIDTKTHTHRLRVIKKVV